MMRVLVCGGRDFGEVPWDALPSNRRIHRERANREWSLLNATLSELNVDHKVTTIIHGGYRGADTHAGNWAQRNMIACQVFKAAWKKDGKAAGPLRNQRMIDQGRPDLVVAFAGGDGTADMIRRAHKAGIPVREVA